MGDMMVGTGPQMDSNGHDWPQVEKVLDRVRGYPTITPEAIAHVLSTPENQMFRRLSISASGQIEAL